MSDSAAPPRPPLGAQQFTTACDYCVVGCSYRVWRWPVDARGTPNTSIPWANPSQHNIVQWQGEPHHVLVLPDPQAKAVNPKGNHSMRGGTLAQKCHNSANRTRERLSTPLLRVNGSLQPVSWDTAMQVMATVSKHVLAQHGEHAWGIKAYSYQYFENTYAITKLAFDGVGTPAFAPHDKCANTHDATGLDDAGQRRHPVTKTGRLRGAVPVRHRPVETKSTLFTGGSGRRPAGTSVDFATPPHHGRGLGRAARRLVAASDSWHRHLAAQRHRARDRGARLAGPGLY
jgi:arsenite oxidase large subunit